MDCAVAHLVHTEEAALAESSTCGLETGSEEPGAISSVEERSVHTGKVSGSTPLSPTIPKPPAREPRFVYFIFSTETERVKIGIARDPWRRLAHLQIGAPEELGLIGFMIAGDARERERSLHERFASIRVRGEWFRLTDELMDCIKNEGSSDWDWLDRMVGAGGVSV